MSDIDIMVEFAKTAGIGTLCVFATKYDCDTGVKDFTEFIPALISEY